MIFLILLASVCLLDSTSIKVKVSDCDSTSQFILQQIRINVKLDSLIKYIEMNPDSVKKRLK